MAEIFIDHVDRVRLYSLSLLDRLSLAEPLQQFTRALTAAFDEFRAAVVIVTMDNTTDPAPLMSSSSASADHSDTQDHHQNHHTPIIVHRQRQPPPGQMPASSGYSSTGGGSGDGCGKKSWSELKSVVSDLRRSLSGLSSMVPMNVHFRTLSDGRVRIYFLSTPPNGWETTLLYADISPDAALNEGATSDQQQRPPL